MSWRPGIWCNEIKLFHTSNDTLTTIRTFEQSAQIVSFKSLTPTTDIFFIYNNFRLTMCCESTTFPSWRVNVPPLCVHPVWCHSQDKIYLLNTPVNPYEPRDVDIIHIYDLTTGHAIRNLRIVHPLPATTEMLNIIAPQMSLQTNNVMYLIRNGTVRSFDISSSLPRLLREFRTNILVAGFACGNDHLLYLSDVSKIYVLTEKGERLFRWKFSRKRPIRHVRIVTDDGCLYATDGNYLVQYV